MEDVGLVRLEPVPERMRASIKGMLVLEGGTGVSQAIARLMIAVDPINAIPRTAAPSAFVPEARRAALGRVSRRRGCRR